MIKETVVRYGRYGVPPSEWYEEPISYIIDCMGRDALDERGDRFKDYVRLTFKNPSISCVQIVAMSGKVRTQYNRKDLEVLK